MVDGVVEDLEINSTASDVVVGLVAAVDFDSVPVATLVAELRLEMLVGPPDPVLVVPVVVVDS